MTYLSEFRISWRPLTAAALGLGSALAINGYVHSILGPHLLAEFHWSKSSFALLGSIYILAMVFVPLSGRLADVFGVRRVAMVGVTFYPISFVALSMMSGEIWVYYVINILQIMFCASTTSTVYCRVVAERFTLARGLALGLLASGPAIAGAVGSPLLTTYIDAHGWRAGCLAVAAFSALAGGMAMLLMPSMRRQAQEGRQQRRAGQDYRAVLRSRTFWIIFSSIFLCSIPYALAQSQLNVMLLDRQLSPAAAGFIISTFAAGVMAGRFILGLALDRFPTHWVAAVGMALSGIGLCIMAAPVTHIGVLVFAIALFGLSYGAEADILGYAVVRYFGMELYGTVLGLLTAAAGGAMTFGSLMLSLILAKTDNSYSLFMLLTAGAVFVGSANFLRLRNIAPAPAKAPATHGLEVAQQARA